jgi:hypothetical protein
MKKGLTLLAALLAVAVISPPSYAVGANPVEAIGITAGIAERWLDGGNEPGTRDLEAIGNATFGVTHHLDLSAGIAYGFQGSYVRGHADVRMVATDEADPTFNLWIGVGRYFSERTDDGLNEWAGKAGLGWVPVPKSSPITLGVTAGVGLDTERRTVSVSLTYPLKKPKGGY